MPIAGVAEKNSLATKYGVDATHAAVFTGDPGTPTAAANEVTGGSPAYARKPITWSAAANGVVSGTVVFDIPSGTTITYGGVASSVSGATMLDKGPVTSQVFAAQGTYTLTLTYTQT